MEIATGARNGLEALAMTVGGCRARVQAFATPGLHAHCGPVLLLVCGSTPGGNCGVWGRSLCINDSTLQGAMHRSGSLSSQHREGEGDLRPCSALPNINQSRRAISRKNPRTWP